MLTNNFITALTPPAILTEPALWFAYQDQQLLILAEQSENPIPQLNDFNELGLIAEAMHYLGTLNNQSCFAVILAKNQPLPDHLQLASLRQIYWQLGETLLSVAGRALQIVNWDINHRFCGRCATPMQTQTHERVKQCPACELQNYPRLSPAVIVAIKRDNKILLAHSPHFRTGLYSVLAGFIEAGETAEAAAAREVWEEVKIKITNLRYITSQPWPFPDSLMLGFLADYESGEISIDGNEIVAADWFSLENLPTELPPTLSISRHLIELTLHNTL